VQFHEIVTGLTKNKNICKLL